MLTPALEASDEAAASLAEAQQAQIAMQETIALAGTNAAAKTESWAALQQRPGHPRFQFRAGA